MRPRSTRGLARHGASTVALACVAMATSCFLRQELDINASRGPNVTTGGAESGSGGGPVDSSTGRPGSGGDPSSTGSGGDPGSFLDGGPGLSNDDGGSGGDPCDQTRWQAHTVLSASCAGCHEAPANQANFNFVLELEKLVTAVASTGERFVVPGDPDRSRIYQRISSGEMPPSGRMPRPSKGDVDLVRRWISTCAAGTGGWNRPPNDADARSTVPEAAPPEAGPPPGCGDPGQACCTANVCNSGGCCVFGQCRAAGQTCAAASSADIGLPGTCASGSCADTSGSACGQVDQPCCDNMTCTASRASCLVGMTTCQACGGAGQPCCKIGSAQNCLSGQACVGAGVGRTGSCQTCGDLGQPCCGTGVAAQKTCNGTLTCGAVSGMGDRCGM